MIASKVPWKAVNYRLQLGGTLHKFFQAPLVKLELTSPKGMTALLESSKQQIARTEM